jgi:hypothetical protein
MRMLLGLAGAMMVVGCAQAPMGGLASLDSGTSLGGPSFSGQCDAIEVAGVDICRHAALDIQSPSGELIQQIVGEERPLVILAGGV